jgi:hypothetical protein
MTGEGTRGTTTDGGESDLMSEGAIGTETMTDKEATSTIPNETGEVEPLTEREKRRGEAEAEKRMRRSLLRWAARPRKREEP